MQFESKATISAEPEAVWAVLVDTPRWPEFDPCVKVEGEPALGKKVKVFTKLAPGRAFPVKVTRVEPPSEMVWTGVMPFGLFKGQRTFTIRKTGDGRSEFVMREVFSGPMLGLIGKSLPDMTDAFDAFCRGLKERVEQETASSAG